MDSSDLFMSPFKYEIDWDMRYREHVRAKVFEAYREYMYLHKHDLAKNKYSQYWVLRNLDMEIMHRKFFKEITDSLGYEPSYYDESIAYKEVYKFRVNLLEYCHVYFKTQ